MKRVNSESNTKQGLSIAESCASSTTVKTSVNNNIESNNAVYNAIIAAIKGDRMIGRHIAQTYGTNGPRPVYGIEVWESIVYVHTDTDRRIFDKAIDRLLKAHTDLFKWADFQKVAEDGPHIVLALTDETVKAKKEAEKAIREAEKERKAQERQERYNARCKELEAEALAQMPYKVGDTVKSRYGETGRVIEMRPEITGDIDSPHLIYEYDGKPTVNVVIEVNGKRSCAHWSVYTLEPASEIKEAEGIKVGDKVRHNKHEEVATVTAIREAFVNGCDGYRYLYTLDFGQSVKGPFDVELNGGEFLREAFTLYEPSEISDAAHPSSWMTDFTADDFRKLKANPEAMECDPDIMGKRLRLTDKDGKPVGMGELQVFISDYAGNEKHALFYIWDEWMQEVRANVRSLEWLRSHFCEEKGWRMVS